MRRQFRAPGPDRLWVADVKQIPTGEGWLYLGVVLDVWSRGVVGWGMRPDARAELVVDALEMAR
ncbi:MAG: DDE-type integrase/transposase/recombinase [Armatimonadota bacterium]|nr:DDE-type integrase/transposase/recombinase [Armatimonadota bacterium]